MADTAVSSKSQASEPRPRKRKSRSGETESQSHARPDATVTKKRKRDRDVALAVQTPSESTDLPHEDTLTLSTKPEAAEPLVETPVKKSKRHKKSKGTQAPTDTDNALLNEQSTQDDNTTQETQPAPSNKRFIAFIGNLPYETTTKALERHFHAIKPDSIRHLTEKEGKIGKSGQKKAPRSKGYAFLEFSSYDRMLTCLKLYHHSLFSAEDPGEATGENTKQKKSHKAKDNARRINVELTAGGGGSKSESRKERLREKNERLAKQRERRAKTELAEKKKRHGEHAPSNEQSADLNVNGHEDFAHDESGDVLAAEAPEPSGIHPSRLAMLDDRENGGGKGLAGFPGGRGGKRGTGKGAGRGRGGGVQRAFK